MLHFFCAIMGWEREGAKVPEPEKERRCAWKTPLHTARVEKKTFVSVVENVFKKARRSRARPPRF